MPPWSHVHPLVVHFPIAFLLGAPGLVLLGLVWPGLRPGLHAAALALLLAGTLGALVAVATGEAAATLAQRTPALRAAVDRHETFAQLTALLFSLLTLLFAGLFLRARLRREPPLILYLLWLAAAAGAMPVLAFAAHLGGRMVHELGIHAVTP
jgi:uncharacterized membrane protein